MGRTACACPAAFRCGSPAGPGTGRCIWWEHPSSSQSHQKAGREIPSGLRFRQLEELRRSGGPALPLAEHVNTVCNDKIDGLPADFAGAFVLEESYYTTEGKTHASPHLFLFTEEGEAVKLTSYQLPKAADGGAATYETLPPLKWEDLEISEKFTPALYTLHDGVWEGGSVSMFSPVLKFTLYERFSQESLEVAETMEVNGKRTFGYDVPIVYRRAAD